MIDPVLKRRYWEDTVGLSPAAADFLMHLGVHSVNSAHYEDSKRLRNALIGAADLASEIMHRFTEIMEKSEESRRYGEAAARRRQPCQLACAKHYKCSRLIQKRCSWCDRPVVHKHYPKELHSSLCPDWNYMGCECQLLREKPEGGITVLELEQEGLYGLRPDYHHIAYQLCPKHGVWLGKVDLNCPKCEDTSGRMH